MVKRRDRIQHISDADVERFAREADSDQPSSLDPKAPRKYKSIAIPFNEYEFKKLEFVCDKTGRSKNSLIRYLILKYAEELE